MRKYVDVFGIARRLKVIKPGYTSRFWKNEEFPDTSTIWEDLDSGARFQIPDSAWDRLKIDYKDIEGDTV